MGHAPQPPEASCLSPLEKGRHGDGGGVMNLKGVTMNTSVRPNTNVSSHGQRCGFFDNAEKVLSTRSRENSSEDNSSK